MIRPILRYGADVLHVPAEPVGQITPDVEQLIDDVASIGVDILTIGQYLRPSESHLPIARYVEPDEFNRLRDLGLARGLAWVESGPLVRSSYRAEQQVAQLSRRGPRPEAAPA